VTKSSVEFSTWRQIVLKSVEQFAEIIGSGASGIVDRKLVQMGTSEDITQDSHSTSGGKSPDFN
jgi:hypothetical protein